MQTPSSFFAELEDLLQTSPSPDEIKKIGRSPFLEEHELALAAYALLSKQSKVTLKPLSSGAIPLFSRGFFPWGGLPYPRDHAHLGALLVRLGMLEMAQEMARFQQATFDHRKLPIHSFFSQESGLSYGDLIAAKQIFFEALDLSIADQTRFFDYELGIAQERTLEKTVLCLGAGCKSGMGAFLYRDAGFVNFGPQLAPAWDCKGFGLAGRPSKLALTEDPKGFSLSYKTRLAAPHPRETGYNGLSDSGYSACWIEARMESSQDTLSCACDFKGSRPLETLTFSFFGKGEACLVAGCHKLNPHSLDRYQGPAQLIELKGKEGSTFLRPDGGFSHMEVIPLAGDDSFWGSDFLITCSLSSPTIFFNLLCG